MKINEARTIGAANIKKLKQIVLAAWNKDNDIDEETIVDQLPTAWFDTWESAADEIRRLIYDQLMDLAHDAPQQVKLKESRIAQFDEFVSENQKELDFSKQTYTRKEVIDMLENAYAEAAGSYNDYGMNSHDPSIIKSAKEFVKKYMNKK